MNILRRYGGSSGRILAVAMLALPLAGCETFTTSVLSAGTSAGVQAGITTATDGTTYRTFTAPLPDVRSAALLALQRMQIDVRAAGRSVEGMDIVATTVNRNIDIRLEEISPNATRMLVTAKSGMFPYDTATGAEILRQTGREISPAECGSEPAVR